MSLALTTTHENCSFQRSCHVPGDTTTYENGFSLLCHQAEVETHSKGLGVSSLFTWCRAPGEEGFSTEYPSFL